MKIFWGKIEILCSITLVLCKLEWIYPLAFFDIMVHLPIHLPREAILGGPVHTRWMYPFERYLGTLKQYVRNKARPEGSIAEAYIVNEALTFGSMYLHGVEIQFNRGYRHDLSGQREEKRQLSVFQNCGWPLGKKNDAQITFDLFDKDHWYILNNCPQVQPYIE